MIKHVSFDVWHTIALPNPYFGPARINAVVEVLGISKDRAEHAYRLTKHQMDFEHINNPKDVSNVHDAYAKLIDNCIAEPMPLNVNHDEKVRLLTERLFTMMPPKITSEAQTLIADLAARDITVSIGSNTAFISGHVMHSYLQRRLNTQLLFGIYSDIIRAAKPAREFYQRVIDNVRYLKGHTIPNEILHVGDSFNCDVAGPKKFGFQSLLIPNTESLYYVVMNHIAEQNHA